MTLPTFTRGEWEDIGDGVRIRRVFRDGVLDALDWQHGCTVGCDDFVPLRRGAPTGPFSAAAWEIHSEEPLTISPSLLCTVPSCKRHGFIREGRWVPA